MKFIALVTLFFGVTVNAQETTETPQLLPAVQKIAIVEGKKYRIIKDKNNKFVFIEDQDTVNGFAVKPIIVIPTFPEK